MKTKTWMKRGPGPLRFTRYWRGPEAEKRARLYRNVAMLEHFRTRSAYLTQLPSGTWRMQVVLAP